MKILVLNGPNLNLLGKREPEVYGNQSLDDVNEALQKNHPNVEFTFLQSNEEGQLINILQEHGFSVDGVVLNPGGYTHTSVAIRDCIAAISAPVIEVHISNIHQREDFRRISLLAGVCQGGIFGLGIEGYDLAVRSLIKS